MDKQNSFLGVFGRIIIIVSIFLGVMVIYQLARYLLGGSWNSGELSTAVVTVILTVMFSMVFALGKLWTQQRYEFRILHDELKQTRASLTAQISQMDQRLVRVEQAVRKS